MNVQGKTVLIIISTVFPCTFSFPFYIHKTPFFVLLYTLHYHYRCCSRDNDNDDDDDDDDDDEH